MKFSSYTDIGVARPKNEDACLIVPSSSRLAIEKRICLAAIADGMGGHNAGEIASHMALDLVFDWYKKIDPSKVCTAEVEELIVSVNEVIWQKANQNAELEGMGTTLTLAIISEKLAIVGHVGDSRLYLLRAGCLKQLTEDHNLFAQQKKIAGANETVSGGAAHILTKAIGCKQFIKPDVFNCELEENDLFLLCTDGITGVIEDERIKNLLVENSVEKSAARLCEEARALKSRDNSTAVVVMFNELPMVFPSVFSLKRLVDFFKHRKEAGLF